MKATGIVRRIDDLGRVVIPKEIRRTMRIREGDPLLTTLKSELDYLLALLRLADRLYIKVTQSKTAVQASSRTAVFLQTYCHIRRNTNYILFETKTTWMNDIALSDPCLILLPKAFQGLYGISLAGLNFNRIHFVFQLTVVGNKKIYFNIVSVLFSVVMCIEIQFVTVCRQHLSNGVLVKAYPHSCSACHRVSACRPHLQAVRSHRMRGLRAAQCHRDNTLHNFCFR